MRFHEDLRRVNARGRWRGSSTSLRSSDSVEWYQLSVSFHCAILVASRWEGCLRCASSMNAGRTLAATSSRTPFFSAHVAEWRQRNRALFEACKRRDVDAALLALDVMRRLSTAQIRKRVKELLNDRQPAG
jgi:DNA-binding GntR family transcriptional regulator